MLPLLMLTVSKANLITPARVCFDLEAGSPDLCPWCSDDEINEETTCTICAANYKNGLRTSARKCKSGIEQAKWHPGGLEEDCINMSDDQEDFRFDEDVYVSTNCGDGMWVNRFQVIEARTRDGLFTQIKGGRHRWFGIDNDKGWCMSTDISDHDKFRAKVPDNTCYTTLVLGTNGEVNGYQGWSMRRLAGGELSVEDEMDLAAQDTNPEHWVELGDFSDDSPANTLANA